MHQHIRHMIASGACAVHFVIQHQRKPRQRLPVRGKKCCKRPGNTAPVKPGLDIRIAQDIPAVIVNDEFELTRLLERHDDDQRHSKANEDMNGMRTDPLTNHLYCP